MFPSPHIRMEDFERIPMYYARTNDIITTNCVEDGTYPKGIDAEIGGKAFVILRAIRRDLSQYRDDIGTDIDVDVKRFLVYYVRKGRKRVDTVLYQKPIGPKCGHCVYRGRTLYTPTNINWIRFVCPYCNLSVESFYLPDWTR